jgi:hypothetical protein
MHYLDEGWRIFVGRTLFLLPIGDERGVDELVPHAVLVNLGYPMMRVVHVIHVQQSLPHDLVDRPHQLGVALSGI